jgi:hypothetical protein
MDEIHEIRFVLKNGYSFTVLCRNAKIARQFGEITGYHLEGIVKNSPLYIHIDDIAAIIDEGLIETDNPASNQ